MAKHADDDLEAGNYYVVEGKYLRLCTSMASQANNDDGDLEAGTYCVVEEGKYLGLYRAIVQESWDNEDQKLFNQHDIVVPLNNNLDTALHVVARRHVSLSFAEKLVAKLPADNDEALLLKNRKGLAPLHLAARYGNLEVAKILVQKNSKLLYDRCKKDLFPIHYAAQNTLNSVEVYRYFLGVTKDNEDGEVNPYEGPSGATILVNLIKSKFYVVAKELVDKYPDLTRHHTLDKETSPLEAIVKYDCPILNKTTIHQLFSKIIVQKKMLKQEQEAMELLKCLCDKLKTLNGTQVASLAKTAIIEAAYLDIEEVVQNIVEAYPTTAYYQDKSGRNILHIAVENRCINVFNLVCGPGRTSVLMHDLVDERDNNGNNIVHLAGKLTPPHKLNLVSVAALKMQRELQWFKEVKKISPPYFSSLKNKDGKTPEMVFTDEHKGLKEGAEKWMKDTATSCTIVAALIVTVMFAAAITVPGGSHGGENSNDAYIGNITFPVSNVFGPGFNTAKIVAVPNATTHTSGENKDQIKEGFPIFTQKGSFTAFYISNGASLFTSVTSLLLFLSILTSRFKEEDFLYALPRRLIIGLFTLLISIIFMMVAFSTTVFLVFGSKKFGDEPAAIVLVVVSCVPVVSFVILQFRLLVALLWSTYGWGIFHKRRDIPQMLF
ncbi:ankyrin repeat-containing protein ITN1-like isoform X2 [Ipomoea triloba]|uniref:ankyrin repeat-containing protein ITN1-like isoform X2 n=1 Tax=Ipomoea triloba TaxID=35885 RepID=UPI00125D9206|nr:ankyrin repeat-containing protein ITN1-like isoform X2 [Ipomoea triloba]